MPTLRSLVVLLALAAGLAACGTPRPVGTRIPGFAFGDSLVDGPAPFDSSAFNFLIVGDWGRNGFFNQADVARGMGRVGERVRSRFTISTGDNFYTAGVTGVNDVKWVRSFEAIYTAPSLQSRWYVTLGNHDWMGDVPAQIEYTERSDRWYLPAQYYAETMTLGDSTASHRATRVLFVFLDTLPIATERSHRSRFSQTGVWDDDAQLAWLDQTLASSDAEWKIVVGHHPVYTGSTSYLDNPFLIERLVPIFERRGVQIYFAGHDHNLQHHRPPGSPVDYFISGAGSLTREVVQTPNTLFAYRSPGFMVASASRNGMVVRSYDEDGNVIYSADVPRARGRRLPLPFGLGE